MPTFLSLYQTQEALTIQQFIYEHEIVFDIFFGDFSEIIDTNFDSLVEKLEDESCVDVLLRYGSNPHVAPLHVKERGAADVGDRGTHLGPCMDHVHSESVRCISTETVEQCTLSVHTYQNKILTRIYLLDYLAKFPYFHDHLLRFLTIIFASDLKSTIPHFTNVLKYCQDSNFPSRIVQKVNFEIMRFKQKYLTSDRYILDMSTSPLWL